MRGRPIDELAPAHSRSCGLEKTTFFGFGDDAGSLPLVRAGGSPNWAGIERLGALYPNPPMLFGMVLVTLLPLAIRGTGATDVEQGCGGVTPAGAGCVAQ